MAGKLWILRHGDAVPHDSREDDSERELTPRGERQALAAGAALSRLGVELAACYTSPKVRALDTARLACRSLGVEPVVEQSLAGGFDVDDLRALLKAHDGGDSLLIVGHEPDLSQLVRDLTGARVDFKKGGVAALGIDGRRADLRVLMRPLELESVAGAENAI